MRARDAARKAAPGTAQRKLRESLSAYGNELLDQVLSEHAHELAEKIRKECEPFDDGAYWAADLIDPEVK